MARRGRVEGAAVVADAALAVVLSPLPFFFLGSLFLLAVTSDRNAVRVTSTVGTCSELVFFLTLGIQGPSTAYMVQPIKRDTRSHFNIFNRQTQQSSCLMPFNCH